MRRRDRPESSRCLWNRTSTADQYCEAAGATSFRIVARPDSRQPIPYTATAEDRGARSPEECCSSAFQSSHTRSSESDTHASSSERSSAYSQCRQFEAGLHQFERPAKPCRSPSSRPGFPRLPAASDQTSHAAEAISPAGADAAVLKPSALSPPMCKRSRRVTPLQSRFRLPGI